jgi:hypothetical protein
MSGNYPSLLNEPLSSYGAPGEYAEVLVEQMNSLYLLSFLVTADRQLAEICFSGAMDEYVRGRTTFTAWVKKDGRLAVLRHAVQIIRPVPKQAYSWSLPEIAPPLIAAAHQPFAAITSLSAFERFVFVMSVFEGLTDEECGSILNCSMEEVAIGCELARNIITPEDIGFVLTGEMDFCFIPTMLGHQRCALC